MRGSNFDEQSLAALINSPQDKFAASFFSFNMSEQMSKQSKRSEQSERGG